MNWEDIKTKKWKLLKILLGMILLLILLYFILVFYLSFAPCTWPLALTSCSHGPELSPFSELPKQIRFWSDNYSVGKNLNTFKLPYSGAIPDCIVEIYITFLEAPKPAEKKVIHEVFVESAKIEDKELLSEPMILRYQYGKITGDVIVLAHILTRTEGVLELKMKATNDYHISVEMGQYEGVECQNGN